jgi:hypothetical protein
MSKFYAMKCILADFQIFLCVSHSKKAPSTRTAPPTDIVQLDLIGWVLALRVGAFVISPHLRQEIRGLRSVYTANMAGYILVPLCH